MHASSRPAVFADVELPPQSLTLMRNLLRTGVSTICYMRDIFGDEEFSVRAHCHLSVLLLPCKSEG